MPCHCFSKHLAKDAAVKVGKLLHARLGKRWQSVILWDQLFPQLGPLLQNLSMSGVIRRGTAWEDVLPRQDGDLGKDIRDVCLAARTLSLPAQ